jgi:putative membrane protein insertion efficiency factor
MRRLLLGAIALYQQTLSPDHGLLRGRFPHGFCRFYPSCSEYMRLSILRHGLFRGLWLGMGRVLRCNPFRVPGVDKVPDIKFQALR